ncbi:MAG: cytochrome c [Burkholderiaceae bacterium]|nr:cytochrome c [Burkholderiaceae bacterium]
MRQILAIAAALAVLAAAPIHAQEVKNELYTVVDGSKVDAGTMTGFRTWRSAACDRCHGANQEGSVGPSLIDSLKKIDKDEFVRVVMEGRLDRGMPSFKENKQVAESIEKLYAYLKGRSNGDIKKAKVEGLQ